MDNFLAKVTTWARGRQDIKALILVGSRARTDRPADIWSDYDIIIIVDDPKTYIRNDSWFHKFGRVILTFIEKCAIDDSFERRVLFDNGQALEAISTSSPGNLNPHVLDLYRRGYQVLLDNIKISSLLEEIESLPPLKSWPPSSDLFINVINDFFYHCIWAVKKLMRGELWMAKHCLNGYMQKNCLLKIIEWHAQAQNNRKSDTWFSGRFMEKWADKKIIGRLNKIDARYDRKDIVRALYNMMTLFDELARETAALLHYTYEHKKAEWTRAWIKKTVLNLN